MAAHFLHNATRFLRRFKNNRGQSYIEFILVLPVILILLLGLIEVVFFIGSYLDMLDLTRQAARFASVRDPFDALVASDQNCSTPNQFDFYYDTACIFSPPAGSSMCTVPTTSDPFCNGMNPYVNIDPARDDVVISVYTVRAVTNFHGPGSADDEIVGSTVSNVWPASGYWNLSGGAENWKRDCEGNLLDPAPSAPHYTESLINSVRPAYVAGSQAAKGFVAVEVYYCHEQVLNLGILSEFVPNPMRIHAYTIMPLPAAQPTPTTTVVP